MAQTGGNQTKSFIKFMTPVVVILVILWCGLFLIKSKLENSSSPSSVAIGSILPDFELVRLDKTSLKVSELKSKLYLINFWASWCESCMIEMPSLVKLQSKFKDSGFEIISINVDQNPEMIVPQLIQKYKMNFSVYLDQNQTLSELFNVYGIPLSVVMDHSRKVLLVHFGEKEWDSKEVVKTMEALLSG